MLRKNAGRINERDLQFSMFSVCRRIGEKSQGTPFSIVYCIYTRFYSLYPQHLHRMKKGKINAKRDGAYIPDTPENVAKALFKFKPEKAK